MAIPIIVHLFNFRKTRKIYFSNTRFIKKIKEASKSRRKLKHYLVLFSRLMFLFWLVMAFAQPFIPADKGGLTDENVYFYLDNSYSMSRRSGEQINAIEEGIEYIENLVELYPAGTDFYLLTNDFAPYSYAPHSASQIMELLTEVKLTGVIRGASDIINRWQSQQQTEGVGDFYFISDMQRSTFGVDEFVTSDSTLDLNMIPVVSEDVSNVLIDTAYIDNPFLIGKENVTLNVVVKNNSLERAEEVQVSVLLNEVQTGSTTIDLEPSSEETLTFDLAVGNENSLRGRISIEEFPVTYDNDLFFVLNLGDKISILEIKGEGASVAISSVYGNNQLFNYTGYSSSNLDYNQLNNADLVVLNSLEIIDPPLVTTILTYLDQGGNLLVIPSPQKNIESYQRLFGGIQPIDSMDMADLKAPDFDNPFFSQVFQERDPAVDMPSAKAIYTWNGGTDIMEFRSGQPFLTVMDEQLYLLASPLSGNYTDFYQHALFVPVMYKIAALSSDQDNPLYFYMDQRLLTLDVDSVSADQIFRLVSNDGEVIPSQRQINQNLILQLPAYLLNEGYYQLVYEGQKYKDIAFNIDKKESILESVKMEDLENLISYFPNMKIYEIEDAEQFRKTLEGQYVGSSLWRYCLILAILFMIAEILILRFIP